MADPRSADLGHRIAAAMARHRLTPAEICARRFVWRICRMEQSHHGISGAPADLNRQINNLTATVKSICDDIDWNRK